MAEQKEPETEDKQQFFIYDPQQGGFISSEKFLDATGNLVAPEGFSFINANFLREPKRKNNRFPKRERAYQLTPAVSSSSQKTRRQRQTINPMVPGGREKSTAPLRKLTRKMGLPDPRTVKEFIPRTNTKKKRAAGVSRRRSLSEPVRAKKPEAGNSVKQALVDETYEQLKAYFEKEGSYVCIRNERGGATFRVTVKSVEHLQAVYGVVGRLNNTIKIKEFSLHQLLRTKKRNRKKAGLTLYVKFADPKDAPAAQKIFDDAGIRAVRVEPRKPFPEDSAAEPETGDNSPEE